MNKKLIMIAVASTVVLQGCATYTKTYDADGNVTRKEPVVITAMGTAERIVDKCAADATAIRGKIPIDTSTEAGRWHSLAMTQEFNKTIDRCYAIVQRVAVSFNLTEQQRYNLYGRLAGIGGGLIGGALVADAVTDLAKQAGTHNSNNTVSIGSTTNSPDPMSGEAAATATTSTASTNVVIGDGNTTLGTNPGTFDIYDVMDYGIVNPNSAGGDIQSGRTGDKQLF